MTFKYSYKKAYFWIHHAGFPIAGFLTGTAGSEVEQFEIHFPERQNLEWKNSKKFRSECFFPGEKKNGVPNEYFFE